jgi:cyclopropane-fatty-acyl-phospholipid synthase
MSATSFAPLSLPACAPASAQMVFRLLKRLRHGTLTVQLPDGSSLLFGSAGPGGSRAAMHLHDWAVCAAVMKSGDIGLAETYIAGDWTTPDLRSLLQLFIVNRDAIEDLVYGRWWGSLLYRLKHVLNRNSRRGSERNVHAHYDLGNAFYRLWLDPTMNYSSAWFDGDHARSMEDAQQAKLRRVLRECAVGPGERLLEIGCGWGALAECAVRERGAAVTGVTLSREQLAWALQRLAAAGLQADLRYQDYREIGDGPYDAIASIEMFEAVGRAYWPAFFEILVTQLKPGGRACVQTIVIRDELFDRYVNSTDFIQQYVFPGGLLPSPHEFRKAAARAGLEIVNELEFGLDYAETLRRWRERFSAQETRVRGLGFDTRFMRIWEFYLAYCEAAFAAGDTQVVQFTLRRP